MITNEQWAMPVSLDETGNLISLKDYVSGKRRIISFLSLSEDQRTELAAKRIESQPDYQMTVIGAGVVGRERAAEEVRARTRLGLRLAEIETRVVMHVIDEAANTK
jgi:hypothetical protein